MQLTIVLLGASAVSGTFLPFGWGSSKGGDIIPWPRVKLPSGLLPKLVDLSAFEPHKFKLKILPPKINGPPITKPSKPSNNNDDEGDSDEDGDDGDGDESSGGGGDNASSSSSSPSAVATTLVPSTTTPMPSVFKTTTSSSPPTSSPTNPATNSTAKCASPEIRLEWRNMQDAQKASFIQAARCLMDRPTSSGFNGAKNRHEELVWVHQQMSPTIHMVAQFLPWHRYYQHLYIQLLREECAYTGPIPWWDETRDAGAFSKAPLFTDAYYGPAPAITAQGFGTCVQSGTFGGVQAHVGPGANFQTHCLSRAVDEKQTIRTGSSYVAECQAYTDYDGMQACSQYGPHLYGHNGLGAIMSDVASSPSDPVFFMHHAFIDRNWADWQKADQDARLYQITGSSDPDNYVALTTSYVLTSKGLKSDVTINDVMDTEGEYLCYRYDY